MHVWTGRELIFWGGDTGNDAVHHAGGAAFDPTVRRWRPLPPAPIAGRSQAGAVWTGRELVVWGGTGDDGPLADGAALAPAAQKWRALPAPPLGPRIPVAAVWTGREAIFWGDRARIADDEGAAYDPAANRWRALRSAPLALNAATGVWTGRELVVVGALLDAANASREAHAQAQAYDPETDRWRVLPSPRLAPQASSIVWTSDVVVAADYELRAAAYDPRGRTWRQLRRVPARQAECYPALARVAAVVLAWHCGLGAVLDPDSGRWARVPRRRAAWVGPIGAGGAALFLGGGALHAYKP